MGLLSLVLLLGLPADGKVSATPRTFSPLSWEAVEAYHHHLHAHHRPFPRSRRMRRLPGDDDDTDRGPGARDLARSSVGQSTPADLQLLLGRGSPHRPNSPAGSLPLIYVFCTLLI